VFKKVGYGTGDGSGWFGITAGASRLLSNISHELVEGIELNGTGDTEGVKLMRGIDNEETELLQDTEVEEEAGESGMGIASVSGFESDSFRIVETPAIKNPGPAAWFDAEPVPS
jgi:hypothetical protein